MKGKIEIVSQLFMLALAIEAISPGGVAKAQSTPTGQSSSLSGEDKTFMKKPAKGRNARSRHGKFG